MNAQNKPRELHIMTSDIEAFSASDYTNGKSEAKRVDAVVKRRGRPRQTKLSTDKEKEKKAKLTKGQKVFCDCIIQGMTRLEAYRTAFRYKGGQNRTAQISASNLMKKQSVRDYLKAHQDRLSENITNNEKATRQYVLGKLHEKAEQGKTDNSQLKALELLGKAVGMFTDKIEQKVEKVTPEQLKAELKQHLELVDNVTPIKGKA